MPPRTRSWNAQRIRRSFSASVTGTTDQVSARLCVTFGVKKRLRIGKPPTCWRCESVGAYVAAPPKELWSVTSTDGAVATFLFAISFVLVLATSKLAKRREVGE